MLLRSIVLALFLSVTAPFVVAQENEPEKKDEKIETVHPFFERLVGPDRNIQRRYEQAERLIQAERYAEAGQLLGSILESQSHFLLPPSDFTERTASQTFDAEILRKIDELPENGKNSYRLQYETLAKRLLNDAVERGSLEGIQVVSQNYFTTQAGIDATFLLGMSQYEQGATGPAMFTLRKLLRQGLHTDAHEPMLSLTLATCQLRLGMDDAAAETLQRFLQRFPKPEILFGGNEPWEPQNVDELLDRLRKNMGPPRLLSDWLERAGWLLTFGNATQNPQASTEKPLLELLWQVSSLTRADSTSEAWLLHNYVRRGSDVYLPAGRPLIVDQRLILRGMYETMAVDVRTGKRLWRGADADYRLPTNIASPFRNFAMYGGYGLSSRFSLRILLWHDRISHGMSSDGKRLYTVEGLELMPYGRNSFGWGGVPRIQVGNKQVEDPRSRPGNSLVARDVRTGQVLWRAGKYPLVQKILDQYAEDPDAKSKPPATQPKNDGPAAPAEPAKNPAVESTDSITEEERFLGETWFLGAPLPLYGRLNVIGENAGILRLFVLDGRNGKLIRQQPLLQPSLPFENDYLRRYYGLTPSAANGILYCPTGLGMVAALDATTTVPLWCFSYFTPPKEDPNVRNMRNMRFPFSFNATNEDFQRMFSQTGWQSPCLMIDGNRLILAPPDVPALFCLDAVTGKLLWQKENLKRQDTLYVACIRNGKVYVVTPISMLALSLEDGTPVWKDTLASVRTEQDRLAAVANQDERPPDQPSLMFPQGVVPSGLGIQNDTQYFLPLSDGSVAVVDLDKGTLETVVPLPTVSRRSPMIPINEGPLPTLTSWRNDTSLGNLVGLQGFFFSQAPLWVSCFDQFEPLKKRTEALLAIDPNDAVALTQLGRIRRAEGNVSEAIALFRRSLGQKKSELATTLLRETLLDAIRTDYATWESAAAELESLAEFPEELGEILLVLAQGAAKAGKADVFLDALKKSFRLETARIVRVPIEDGVDAQLNRAFGVIIEQQFRNGTSSLEQVAEELFVQLASVDTLNRFQPPWWEAGENLASEFRDWRLFMEYFRSLPITAKARDSLLKLYEKNERFVAMESMLNPPVHWFPLGLDMSNADGTSSAPPAFAETRRLAELLESQGNTADAFYYYRLLELFHADERDDSLSGKELYQQASGRPLLKRHIDRETAAKTWPSGFVEFPDAESPPPSPIGKTSDKERLERLLRNVQQRDRQTTGLVPVPLIGSYEPFHSAYTYSLETTINESSLVCYDTLGMVRWRCELSSLSPDIQENAYFYDQHRGIGIQQMFLKACNHYLLFVRRNTLIALDTFRASETGAPTILWTKTLTSSLAARHQFGAARLYDLNPQSIMYSPWSQQTNQSLGDPVHPLPNVVCYQDAESIYGVDPMTGETLWYRGAPSFRCTILSDRQHLFLFSGDSNQVLAIDPGSGKTLTHGIVPKGACFAFETNLIGISQPSGGTCRLFVCDLRDVFKLQRERTELSKDEAVPTIADQTIRGNLPLDSLVRLVIHHRFVATLPSQSMTLKLYDLQKKSDCFGERSDSPIAWRKGTELTLKQTQNRHGAGSWDFDIELVDGNPLVLFIENSNIENNQRNVNEDGKKFFRSRQPLNNVPSRAVGFGTMMLYDWEGRKLWDKGATVENWYRLTQTPKGLPVALFAASVMDQPRSDGGPTIYSTDLFGIDKRTGETRFQKPVSQVANQQNSLLQGFRVTADPERDEMSFIAPFRTLTIRFTDKDPPPSAVPKKEIKPFNFWNLWPFN